MTEIRQ